MSRLATGSLLLGMAVGLLIHTSVFGANYLAAVAWGEGFAHSLEAKHAFLFSLLWSFVTSILSMWILACIRQCFMRTCTDDASRETMVQRVECHFVVGALVGVCMAWAALDVALGKASSTMTSLSALATLVVALVWCRLAMRSLVPFPPELMRDDGRCFLV